MVQFSELKSSGWMLFENFKSTEKKCGFKLQLDTIDTIETIENGIDNDIILTRKVKRIRIIGFLIMQIIYCVIIDFIFLLRCPAERGYPPRIFQNVYFVWF